MSKKDNAMLSTRLFVFSALCLTLSLTFSDVVGADLTLDLDINAVAEGDEENPGGFVLLNDDDDNDNGTADKDDGANVKVAGEDDLVALHLTATGSDQGLVKLSAVSGGNKVIIWKYILRGDDDPNNNPDSISLPAEWSPEELPSVLYVEGVATSASPGDVELQLAWNGSGADGDPPPDKVKVTVIKLDLDIVHFGDNDEHVSEADEEKGSKGACLSLNRGSGHRRPILIRPIDPNGVTNGQAKLTWESTKIDLYDGSTKINSGKTYGLNQLPKRLYVDATAASGAKAAETVQLWYVPPAGNDVKADRVAFTGFKVTITLREASGESFSPQAENDKHNIEVVWLGGQDKLGKLEYKAGGQGDWRYGGAVEGLGQLTPDALRASDFYDDEFYWRQNYTRNIWVNGGNLTDQKVDEPDDSYANYQDKTPSDTGKIYYCDSPSTQPTATVPDLKARRAKYEVWCTFGYHDQPMGCACEDTNNCRHAASKYRTCSDANKNFYLRVTLRQTGTGGGVNDKRDNDSCTKGNVFGNAAQTLNYDLLAPVVSAITPNTGQRGTTVTITNLAGDRFVTSPVVKLKKGGDTITATNVVLSSKAKITCKFAIPADAALGNWNVEVTNPAVDDDGDGDLESPQSSNTNITFQVTE
jgi:hypothetical protein